MDSGEYDLELSVLEKDKSYTAARLVFKDGKAEKHIEALVGDEDLKSMDIGEFYGVEIESGLACITDELVYREINRFLKDWEEKNTDLDLNIFDDYFKELFEESYKKNPKGQRPGGDYILWNIPGTEYNIGIFGAGSGNRIYPVYFGYNKLGELVDIIIQFMVL